MVDITEKSNSLREAVAEAVVRVSKIETIEAILKKNVPKGDVFEMAKTAGLFAVKKTSDIIPDCHPLPIEYTSINFKIENLSIVISIHVKTIYKTGVEVEAMHGASVVALTLYDMLKPIDKGIEIQNIKLIEKKGGKSDWKNQFNSPINTSVIICSNAIKNNSKTNEVGEIVKAQLESFGITIVNQNIINDNAEEIKNELTIYSEKEMDLIVFVGGTGISKTDITPETIIPLLDKEIPGIAEAMRSYGQTRTPLAMLSRSFAGIKNKSIVLGIPGSKNGAKESIDALFPFLLHVFKIFKGKK